MPLAGASPAWQGLGNPWLLAIFPLPPLPCQQEELYLSFDAHCRAGCLACEWLQGWNCMQTALPGRSLARSFVPPALEYMRGGGRGGALEQGRRAGEGSSCCCCSWLPLAKGRRARNTKSQVSCGSDTSLLQRSSCGLSNYLAGQICLVGCILPTPGVAECM